VRPPKEASRAFAAEVGWAERMLLLSPFAFTEDVDAGLLERFIEKKSGDVQSEEGYRAQIAAVLAHDASARLGDIGHETLVITGDDDRVIPGANSELLASEIPNARLVVIPAAGHLFFVERPEETLAQLRAFLDGPV
jgi:pimeloyl-ACP methyl ester carboxylesterase